MLRSTSPSARNAAQLAARCFTLLAVVVFALAVTTDGHAQAVLENPTSDSRQSGVGIISGWKCDAGDLSLTLDGGPSTKVAYGTRRGDTAAVCGDTDNGFSFLINWNLLGDGTHTVRLYDNGVQFAESSFEVVTLGATFVRNASRSRHVLDFPTAGEGTTLEWQEGLQNFVVSQHVPRGSSLVRYRGNVTCGNQVFTSTITTLGGGVSWTSVDGLPSGYQLVEGDRLVTDPLTYSDDSTCIDPQPFQTFILESGRRYTLSWKTAFQLQLINDDTDSGPTNVPCFVAGTLVMTPDGEVPIESLQSGDLVVTPNGEWAVVTEVRETPVGSAVPMIEFAAGSVAPGVPSRPTAMTQDHRIGIDPGDLYKGWEFCGAPDVVCEPRELDFVYNLQLDGWKSTFIANGLVADTLQDRDWRLSLD